MKPFSAFILGVFVLGLVTPAWAQEADDTTEDLSDAFAGESDEERGKDVHASVFPLVKYHKHDDESRLKLVHVPGAALVKANESEESSKVEVVDIPFFKLVKSEHHADGRFDNQFLKLPIVGSVFRHKRTDDKEKVRFLIFSHTKHLNDDDTPRQRTNSRDINNRSRGKG